MSNCSVCDGTGSVEICSKCANPVDDCECEYPEGDPPGVDHEECEACGGTGEEKVKQKKFCKT